MREGRGAPAWGSTGYPSTVHERAVPLRAVGEVRREMVTFQRIFFSSTWSKFGGVATVPTPMSSVSLTALLSPPAYSSWLNGITTFSVDWPERDIMVAGEETSRSAGGNEVAQQRV